MFNFKPSTSILKLLTPILMPLMPNLKHKAKNYEG